MDSFPKDTSNLKLLISDYDGTLVGRDRVLSEDTIEAIKRWTDSGRKFTLATGRQYLMLVNDIKKLGLTHPIAVRGGSEIVDPLTGEVIYTKTIDETILDELVPFLMENGFEIAIEQDDIIYSDYYYRPEFEPTITFKRLNEFVISNVPKLVVLAVNGDLVQKSKFMENDVANKFPQLHITRMYPREGKGWDITSEEGTKHLAVLELIKLLGVEVSETVGVGDGHNDYPLLTAVGFKCAMGNAHQELKDMADVVLPPQEEDGVAYLIDNLLGKS